MNAAPSHRPEVPGHVLHDVIGEGATSVVWSGVDAAGHPVAVKIPHVASDPVDLAQGDIERHVLMAVQHEHLVSLRDVVALADGRQALVFDLVRGARLSALVRSRGHLRPGEVVTVLTPICQAIAVLHVAGGLHADLSPGNVMVTADGRPLVLDLGAARLAGAGAGAVVGTPGFVAPEVRGGSSPTTASDVFALGALAWFCLTGNGAPDTDLRLDPETVRSHVGSELAAVVSACIDPDPARRPQAAQLARMFYQSARPEAVEVVVGEDDAAALTHRLRAEAAAEVPGHGAPRQGRRWLAAGLATLAVVLVAGLVWAMLGRESAAARPGSAPSTVGTESSSSGRATSSSTGSVGATLPAPQRSGHDVLLDPAAPRTRPEEVMQALSNHRAAALMERRSAALAGVHAPDSPSRRTDEHLLRTLLDGGDRYVGLRLGVARATWVSGSTDRATVRAKVDWTAYAVLADDGSRVMHPAEEGALLDFALVRGPNGWRIDRISPAPAR